MYIMDDINNISECVFTNKTVSPNMQFSLFLKERFGVGS